MLTSSGHLNEWQPLKLVALQMSGHPAKSNGIPWDAHFKSPWLKAL